MESGNTTKKSSSVSNPVKCMIEVKQRDVTVVSTLDTLPKTVQLLTNPTVDIVVRIIVPTTAKTRMRRNV